MRQESKNQYIKMVRSALWLSRPVLVAFGLLVFLVVQYILRRPLAGVTTTWFETGLPFRVLDWILEFVLAPVQWTLNVLYDPWAPDWAFVVLTLGYFYVLALVIGTLYEVGKRSLRPRAYT